MTGKLLKAAGMLLACLALLLVAAFLLAPGLHVSSLRMALNAVAGRGVNTPPDKLLSRLRVAEGYRLSVFARELPNPRMLLSVDASRLLVSSPRSGQVLQLTDRDGDGFADERSALLAGLTRPHGLAMHSGRLYVAESNQVGRAPYDAREGALSGPYEVVVAGLTDDGGHWSKSIRIDDRGWLYVAMGSTCNVCEEQDERRATIMRFHADGSGGRIYASGLRNSVGMDFAPWSGALYATDNGRDLLGDDYPPCELNRIEDGGFYGWPYLNGDNELDPDMGKGGEHLRESAIAPVFSFRAHNAPLGIHFSRAQARTALVALHGSWNRSTPDGYKVLALRWDAAGNIAASDFLWGFEKAGHIIGRPVDVSGDRRGGYFVSDDYAQAVYRVSRADAPPAAGRGRPAAGR